MCGHVRTWLQLEKNGRGSGCRVIRDSRLQVRTAIRKRWHRYRARRLGKRVGRRRSSRTSSIYLSTSDVSTSLVLHLPVYVRCKTSIVLHLPAYCIHKYLLLPSSTCLRQRYVPHSSFIYLSTSVISTSFALHLPVYVRHKYLIRPPSTCLRQT